MKGIIFKPDSIGAILEGRKTQTRRVIKPQPSTYDRLSAVYQQGITPEPKPRHFEGNIWGWFYPKESHKGGIEFYCPYGQVGETVYIKEAWRVMDVDDNCPISDLSPQDSCVVQYKDSSPSPTDCIMGKWRSPLFMPKWAARHFITITGVRAERLQEITEADFKAEGYKPFIHIDDKGVKRELSSDLIWFSELWDSINPKYPWESNPWVFVYEFELLQNN